MRNMFVPVLAAMAVAIGSAAQGASTGSFPLSPIDAMPPGVTLQAAAAIGPVAAGGSAAKKPAATIKVFADARGMTLYVSDKDAPLRAPGCDAACSNLWVPLAAPAGAKPFGDWSIVTGDSGLRQWAYDAKPLYRYSKDAQVGDTAGNGMDSGNWHIALPQVSSGFSAPGGLGVKLVSGAGGEILVNTQGMTVYVYDKDVVAGKSACTDLCGERWKPVRAGQLAKPTGAWSLVVRTDGTRQWAYKGHPLYTYAPDEKSGDIKGHGLDNVWHAVLLKRYFTPSNVSTWSNEDGWIVLATAEGMSLYTRDRFRFSYGGHSVNDGPPPRPETGREIGVTGCEGECLQTWKPLLAATNDQPSGDWSLYERADGTRQWAYQGYALYSYSGDKKRGDVFGRDIFTMTDGANALYWRVAMP